MKQRQTQEYVMQVWDESEVNLLAECIVITASFNKAVRMASLWFRKHDKYKSMGTYVYKSKK